MVIKKEEVIEISEARQTLEEFISKEIEVASLIAKESEKSKTDFDVLIDEFYEQKTNQRRLDEKETPNINIFDIIRIGHREVLHSRILRWLFDPWESHEQGNLFLRIFADKYDLQVGDSVDYEANVEDTDEHSRIDIAIVKKNMFYICIEVKIFAYEGEKQTSREYETATRKADENGISLENIRCFFLTINGKVATNKKHFESITWNDILILIKKYGVEAKSEKVGWFVSQYIKSIKKTIKESENDRQIQPPGEVDSKEQ